MAFVGKTYQLESFEGVEEFLEAIDAPEALREKIKDVRPKLALKDNEDGTYTATFESEIGNSEQTFTIGEPIERTRFDGTPVTSTYYLEGDTLIQHQIPPSGNKIMITMQFTEDTLEIEGTYETSDIVLKGHFTAVE